MSEKISGMPAATDMANADIFPIVQGGVNKNIVRDTFLSANTGEFIEVRGNGALVQLDSTGNLLMEYAAGRQFLLSLTGHNLIQCDLSGNILITAAPGAIAGLESAGGRVQVDAAGNVLISGSSLGNVQVDYTPLATGDWVSPPPATMESAIDRIAAVVSGGGSTPIP